MLQVSTKGLRGEILGRDSLPGLSSAWTDLCERSAEDNAYYSPKYATALLEHVERDTDIGLAVVWEERQLVAMLPFTTPIFAVPILHPSRQAWQSKYTFGCVPLLDAHRKTAAAEALLEVLISANASEWVIPAVNANGHACHAMIDALERRAAPWALLGRFQRASLTSGVTLDELMEHHISSKRRRELSRNRRRLEKLGQVHHESHWFGEDLHHAVEDFLRIEMSGWKGRRGTALGCDERARKFAFLAFTGDEANSICRADVLRLNGSPIAVSLTIIAGRTGFSVKCCYDERYRSYGVGLLLEIEVIRSFLSENWSTRLDAGTSGEHVIDTLWPERVEVADLAFSFAPRLAKQRLAALRLSSKMRESVKAGLKKGLRQFRRA